MPWAAGSPARRGARLDLNERDRLTLEVDDMITDERTVFFNLKLNW